MILNIKALPFNKLEDVEERFKNIQSHFQDQGDPFKEFLLYFKRNWIEERKFKKTLWNYNKGVLFLYI